MEFIVGFIVSALLICSMVVLFVLCVIACWRLFEKIGEPGWKSLIPYYSNYVLYKNMEYRKLFFLYLAAVMTDLLVAIGASVLSAINTVSIVYNNGAISDLFITALVLDSISLVCAIIILVCNVLVNYRLSKCFGDGIPLCMGLTFVPFIFVPYLAFGNRQCDTSVVSPYNNY